MGAMLYWSLWKSRNDLVWNQRGIEVVDVVLSARVVLNQWQCAQDNYFDHFLGFMTPTDGDEHWTLPIENMIKVNSDAVIFDSSSYYSYSCVARDHKWDLIEARSSCRPGNISPESAEVMGIREALSWIKGCNHRNVQVETDCLVVVHATRSSGVMLSYFGKIIEKCKVLLSDKVAHFLANSSCSIAYRNWRMRDAHSEFIDVLLNDLKY